MKIGIYGGSFSPPHLGHTRLMECFIDEVSPDRLIVIPAGNPPHKELDGGASPADRLDMCRTAFIPVSPCVEVSDYEVFRTDPCYTADTLRRFSVEGELYFLCGSDMFLTLGTWRGPETIFRLATVVCGVRVNDPETHARVIDMAYGYRELYGARCIVLNIEAIEASSTEIREKIKRGDAPDNIADGVFNIICERGLYGFAG